jgi:hypothetical protein
MRGAYLLFTMVITALAAISAACGSLIDPKHGVCAMANLAASDHVDEQRCAIYSLPSLCA